jgi:hypothetical protein
MAKSIFEQHPNLTDAYQTSDGQFFYNENTAKMHAKTLDNKLVKHLENDSSESDSGGKGSLDDSQKKDLTKLTNPKLIEYGVSLGVDESEFKDLKKVDIIARIELALADVDSDNDTNTGS